MTDLEKKKEESYKKYIKEENLSDLSSIETDFKKGFDAGVKAESERLRQLLIDSSDFEFIDYLFPGE